MKVKLSEKIKQSANRIMADYLRDNNSLPEITNAVYANGESSGNQASKLRGHSERKRKRKNIGESEK